MALILYGHASQNGFHISSTAATASGILQSHHEANLYCPHKDPQRDVIRAGPSVGVSDCLEISHTWSQSRFVGGSDSYHHTSDAYRWPLHFEAFIPLRSNPQFDNTRSTLPPSKPIWHLTGSLGYKLWVFLLGLGDAAQTYNRTGNVPRRSEPPKWRNVKERHVSLIKGVVKEE